MSQCRAITVNAVSGVTMFTVCMCQETEILIDTGRKFLKRMRNVNNNFKHERRNVFRLNMFTEYVSVLM